MRRSLIHYWRAHLAVVLGAAVTTAVLCGALVVGDSLRGSLRDLTLQRLGEIDWALSGEHPFRPSLAEDLGAALGGTTPARVLTLRATATAAGSGARASGVALWGVDEDFFALFPAALEIDLAARRGPFPGVALNEALAGELGIAPGAELLLSFARGSDLPRETLVGRQEGADTVEVLRVAVVRVLPDRGAGGFGVEPRQSRALNIFVDRNRLQRAVFGRGVEGVNLLLGAGREASVDRVAAALPGLLRLEDLGLRLRSADPVDTLESERFLLDDAHAAAAEALAHELGAATQPVFSYLANSIAVGARSLPYSAVAALDPPSAADLGSFRLLDGRPAPALSDNEILLNRWAAEDLEAEVGDPVEISYYALGPRDRLDVERRTLTLAGVVGLEGLAVAPHLTPEFPGIDGADDISDWNPPFPVDLGAIRPRDEEYWDLYRATPKAFVSPALGRALWASRFGRLTSLRIAFSDASARKTFEDGLARRLGPRGAGLAVRSLRDEGLRAARGATDFAGLFLGLSLFLIVAAALLAGLLFRLGVERRAAEIGWLRAAGFSAARVRRRFLGEGLALAACGATLGLLGGAGYAAFLLAGLRGWWLPAIGEPVLFLHLAPRTLALGGAISLLVVALAIAAALRRLGRAPIVGLLRGAMRGKSAAPSRRPLLVGLGSVGLALLLAALALVAGARAAAGLALGAGACLLVGGLGLYAHFAGRPAPAAGRLLRGGGPLMAVRNSGRNRARSLLCVALMACATFVIVLVAANRLHEPVDVTDRFSGAGGFTLLAETDVPLYRDLERESAAAAAALGGAVAMPFRLVAGEDVSCLNLYQPERPRLLGVPPAMVARGGFAFRQTLEPSANPWQLLEQDLGPGVVPALGDYNSVLWILHSGLGKEIPLTSESGETIRLRLVGLLDKSLFQSELLISEASLLRYFPSVAGYSYFLLDPPPTRSLETATALERELSRYGFDAVATSERLASFQAVENTYLATFQTLGGLGLILGTLGMGIILLRNILERRAELATLSALGFTRRRLRALVLFENAWLLALGLAIGSLAGVAAAAPTLATAGESLPWSGLAITVAAVFAIGMVASTLAVRALARLPLVASLRAQ